MGQGGTRENVRVCGGKMNPLELMLQALSEDIGRGDLFERIAKPTDAAAKIVAKSDGVLAGVLYADALLEHLGLEARWEKKDADEFVAKDVIAWIFGDSLKLLQVERTLLNTIAHASGIATNAKRFVQKAPTLKVLDTRKTRPGLRVFEKYAARVGGVVNHRMGLDDCLMLKDTHLATLNDEELNDFIQKAKRAIPFTAKIEIECETFEMAKKAMEAGADIVMCDNMDDETIAKVVAFRNERYPHVLLEASGNITLENIQKYERLGVDAVSSGSIIHQAVWPDFSMKVES